MTMADQQEQQAQQQEQSQGQEQPKIQAQPSSHPKESKLAKIIEKFKSFILECKRVLKVTKKPSREEFKTIVKVSSIGVAIIGLIGFAVHIIQSFVI